MPDQLHDARDPVYASHRTEQLSSTQDFDHLERMLRTTRLPSSIRLHRWTASQCSSLHTSRTNAQKLASVTAAFYRGGTSKGVVFEERDLPTSKLDREHLFRSCIGSPDPYGRQLDGMGGGVSSVSKVCIVKPSERADADVDFTFVQVSRGYLVMLNCLY